MNRLYPFVWGGLIFALSEALTLAIILTAYDFIEASRGVMPEVGLGISLVYFFATVVVMGAILFFIPLAKLRLVLKVFFAFLFFWGAFIVFGLLAPALVAVAIATVGATFWFIKPRIWLHNLLIMLSLVSAAVVFGALIAPWTVLLLLLVISIYDIVAVRFGYMLWMANKLFESDTLPAFVLPRVMAGWSAALQRSDLRQLAEQKTTEREYAILGGGDIGFPLLLVVSVLFNFGANGAIVTAITSLGGLVLAFWIQQVVIKGKPLPALAPISFGGFIGYLITRFIL